MGRMPVSRRVAVHRGRPGAPLTDWETAVLELTSQGLLYKEAGRRMGRTESAAREAGCRAITKLEARNIAHAVHIATRRGLIGQHGDDASQAGCNQHQHNVNGVGEEMNVVQMGHLGTVERMLRAERLKALDEVRGELLRLCGQRYFHLEPVHTLEQGLRVALSAVARLADSRHICVADPVEEDPVDVMDEVPNELGSTTRLSKQQQAPAVCSACGRDYRRAASGTLICTHTADCWWGVRMLAG
jgi:DNA-binding CsgD family transcriptional regulator